MEAEIEYLKSELDASRIREETTQKLYKSLMTTLEAYNSEGTTPKLSQQLIDLQSDYSSEIQSIKLSHNSVIKILNETISKDREHIKDLEFKLKSDKLQYQQQILDLQTEIFQMKSEISHLQRINLVSYSDNEKPQILRKQAEHIENLTAEIIQIKEDHEARIQEILLQGKKNIQEIEDLYESDKQKLRDQLQQLQNEFSLKIQENEIECENKAKRLFIDEIAYLNSRISRLLTERNEAQAKLEIFRIEIQHLRDHISSPAVQKSIRDKVNNAKRILEKKTNSKEDVYVLKNILLHLEDGFAKMHENEKIYHRLLLQKEVELKNIKEFSREMQKRFPKIQVDLQDSKLSTWASSPVGSVDAGGFGGRKSLSFSGGLSDDSGFKKKKKIENKEDYEGRLIDELALFKVKYALFEEHVGDRDDRVKNIVRKASELIEGTDGLFEVKQNLQIIMQIIKQPITIPDLQIDDCIF